MFKDNPEFIKNLKLEFNGTRFVIPLILLILACWIGWESVERSGYEGLPLAYYKAKALFGWLCGFGFIFAIVWGTYLCTNSLFDEIKQKTWDFVRMSSLSAGRILFGKLFGSTAVIWIITLLGVYPAMTIASKIMLPEDGLVRSEWLTIGILLLAITSWILLSHCCAIIIGLITQHAKDSRPNSMSGTLLTLISGLFIGAMIIEAFERYHRMYMGSQYDYPTPTGTVFKVPSGHYMYAPPTEKWYGFDLSMLDIYAFTLSFFAMWALIGAYRGLRKSLQYKDSPWAWILFIVSGSLFLNGFTDKGEFETLIIFPVLISVTGMFFTCITEASDIIRYKVFTSLIAAKKYYEAFRVMPLWIIAFCIFISSAIANILTIDKTFSAAVFFVTLLGFMLRDLLVFHIISWTPNIRRPLVGMVVFMAVMYGMIPAIAETISNKSAYYFFPFIENTNSWGEKRHINLKYVILLAGQILLVLPFFLGRWKNAFGKSDEPQAAKA